jgi:hypothetical protein
MNETSKEDLLKRKFEPVSDERRETARIDITHTLKALFDETLEQAQSRKEALERALGPLTDEAGAKIKDMANFLEATATKTGHEARSGLARILEAMAGKIKP